MISSGLADTMQITSIPIICFIVSVIGRGIFRTNLEDLAPLILKTRHLTSLSQFSVGGDWWGVFLGGWGSAIKDQTNTVTNTDNIIQIDESEILWS